MEACVYKKKNIEKSRQLPQLKKILQKSFYLKSDKKRLHLKFLYYFVNDIYWRVEKYFLTHLVCDVESCRITELYQSLACHFP